jgi:hypothetical protein
VGRDQRHDPFQGTAKANSAQRASGGTTGESQKSQQV